LPKLRDHYAEFLDHVSLVHLRLLALPTCVGLRYGRPQAPLRAFLACRLHTTRVRRSYYLAIRSRSIAAPTTLDVQSTQPLVLRSTVPLSFNTYGRGRNLDRLSIGYASGASP